MTTTFRRFSKLASGLAAILVLIQLSGCNEHPEGGMRLAEAGEPRYEIVTNAGLASKEEQVAAKHLARFLERITGAGFAVP